MRSIPTTTRAYLLLATYALLLVGRLAHAAAPGPAFAPTCAGAPPALPVAGADCGPCDNPAHDHQPAHAHDDHCPICQGLRFGADQPALLAIAAPLGASSPRYGDAAAGHLHGAAPGVAHGARAPPVR